MDQDEKLRKCSNMKCQRVQVDESSVPALKDEAMEVDHFLAENRNEHVSVDGGLDIHAAFNGKDDLEMEILNLTARLRCLALVLVKVPFCKTQLQKVILQN